MQDIEKARKPIKILIAITAVCSLASPLISFLLTHTFKLSGPNVWLPLSLAGIKNGWFWQVVTDFFIQSPGMHITLSLLISLFFLMFLLWFAGKEIAEHFGALRFLFLYLSAGIFASLMSLGWLFLSNSKELVYGSSGAIFALLVVLSMLYRDMQLYYFTFVRIKAKWLIGLLIAIPLLIHLTHGEFALFFNGIAGVLWGYIFGILVLKLPSPIKWRRSKKIIDIRPFQRESDEEFMERMLEKIAAKGESALTDKERSRMDSISGKRRR